MPRLVSVILYLNTFLLKNKNKNHQKEHPRIIAWLFHEFALSVDHNWILPFKNMSGGKIPSVLNGYLFVWGQCFLQSVRFNLILALQIIQKRSFFLNNKGSKTQESEQKMGDQAASTYICFYGRKTATIKHKFGNSPFLRWVRYFRL